jgi:hypothetical protein
MGGGNGKTTLGKVISAVAKAGSSAVATSKGFLVGKVEIKNNGKVADGGGAVILLDPPPELTTTETEELGAGKSIEVSSSDYSLPPNFILLPAAPPKKRLDPETPLNADPVARGLFRLGAHRSTVNEAVGGVLSPSELTKASLQSQSSDNTSGVSAFKFNNLQARRLSDDNVSDFLADDQVDDFSAGLEVVTSDEFEIILKDISPEYEQEVAKGNDGKVEEKGKGTSGDEQSGVGHE